MDAADGSTSVSIGIGGDGASIQHHEGCVAGAGGGHAEMCQFSLDGGTIGLRRSATKI
jgi:hypothetical protein